MQNELIGSNPIVKLSFEFSLLVIDYCETLETLRRYVIANQLMKAATSIGANVMEAQNAESKDDFIHKMKVAAKEAEEAQYWLLLCDHATNYPECKPLIMKLEEIQRVLGKILSTSKRNRSL